MNRKSLKNSLKKQGVRPKKQLGQNFLTDKAILNKILEAADIGPKDTILEIGPGTGLLTRGLAEKSGKVIGVEKDPAMAEIARENLKNCGNVEIINKDILKFKIPAPLKNYKIVANLPYYIASPVIRRFLESEHRPRIMVLMVQKEVGKRICASQPKMNLLAVSVQFYAKPEIISYVPKQCFWPRPKINSAIIKITPFKTSGGRTLPCYSVELFFKIVKAGFSQPRKKISNNFRKVLKLNNKQVDNWLLKNKINPSQRAETLSIRNWLDLARTFRP